MTVVTRQRSENYAIIPNAVAEDDRLTFEARGLLCYLLAKPNCWKVRITDIQKSGGIGRDKAYRLIKELRDVGYIVLDVRRAPGGRIEEQNYIVYDCAVPARLPLPENPEQAVPFPEKPEVEKPLPDFPDREKPDAGKSGRFNKNPYLTKPITNNDAFDAWWTGTDTRFRGCSRDQAETLFLSLPAEIDRKHAVEYWNSYLGIEMARGKPPKLLAYLRGKAWRELVDAPETDSKGRFILTPEREEWASWIDDIRARHGNTTAASAQRDGRLLRMTRWPEVGSRQFSLHMAR